jgi:hypothetical protein
LNFGGRSIARLDFFNTLLIYSTLSPVAVAVRTEILLQLSTF